MTTPTLPGFYWYTDQPGAAPERLEVLRDGNTLVARFADDDGDPELVPVARHGGHLRADRPATHRVTMFAYYREDMTGQPWLDIHDANLLEDFGWGCSLFTMAKRAIRSEADVLARLAALGRSLEQQPPPRKIRNITWTRRA